MSIVGAAASWLGRRRLAAMLENATTPGPVQDALLRRIAARTAKTTFGRERGLAGIRSVSDLGRAAPLVDHTAMRPWLDRARAGEPDVVWPGIVRHWAISSGTTSGEKYLPITDATIRSNQRGGFDALVPHLARCGGGMFGGKLLFLGGSTALRREGEVWIGDNTGIMARHVPRMLRTWHAPDEQVRGLGDWDLKVRRAAVATVEQDLRMIAGVPSWIVMWGEAALSVARAQGRRAETLRDIWPALSLFVHGGVTFAPYRARVEELLGAGVECTDTYSASEGGMLAVQDSDDGMLPLLDRGAVFEFVPVDELGREAPRRLAAQDVEPGVDYAVALTTDAGLVSYLVGDTVRFVSTRPLRLLFAGRIVQTLNAFGEHVSGGELDRAVAAAAAEKGAVVEDYAVTVDFPRPGQPKGQHVFLVEFRRPPADLLAFADRIDAALRAGNEDYATHRVYGLRAPLAIEVQSGGFIEWMRRRGKIGGQHKVPRVLSAAEAAELQGLLGHDVARQPTGAPVV